MIGNAFGALIYRGKLGLNPIIFAGDKLCDVLHRTLVMYRVVTTSLGPQSPQTPQEWDMYHRAIANEFRKMGCLHPVFYWEEKHLRSHLSALNVVTQHVTRDKDGELSPDFFDTERLHDCEVSYLRYVSSHLTKILIVSRDYYNCRGVKHLVIELLANSVLVPVLGLFTPSTVSIWLDMLLTMLMPPEVTPTDALPVAPSPSLMNLDMPSLSDEEVLSRVEGHAYAACLYHPMSCPNPNIYTVAYNRAGMEDATSAASMVWNALDISPPGLLSAISSADEDYMRCQCSAPTSRGLIYIVQESEDAFILMMCNYSCDVKCMNSNSKAIKSIQFKSIDEISNLLTNTMELNFSPVQVRAERATSFVNDVVDTLINAAEKSEDAEAKTETVADVLEKEEDDKSERDESQESAFPPVMDIDTDLWMEQERTVLLFDLQGAVEEFIQGNTPTAIVDRDTMYTDGEETLTILNDGVGTRSLARILNVLEALVSHGYITEPPSVPQLQFSASVESDSSNTQNVSLDQRQIEASVHESYFDTTPSPRSNEDESRVTNTPTKNKKKSSNTRSKSISSRIIDSLTPDFLMTTSAASTTATVTASTAPISSASSRDDTDRPVQMSTDAPIESLAYTLLNRSPLHCCSHHLTSHILSGEFFWFWQSALALESLGDRPLNNLMMRMESEERNAHCLCSVSAMSLDDRFVDACEELLSFGLLQSRPASKGSMGSVYDREDHTCITLYKLNAMKIILFESLRHGLLYDRLALMTEMIADDPTGKEASAPWKPTAFLKSSADTTRALELLLPLKGRKVCFRNVEITRPISLNIFGKFNSRRSYKESAPKDATKGRKKEDRLPGASATKVVSQKSEKGLLGMFSDSNDDKPIPSGDKEKVNGPSSTPARASTAAESSSSLLSFVSFPSMDILGSEDTAYVPHLEFSKNADIVQVYRMKRDTADEVWAQKLGRRGGEGYVESSFMGEEIAKSGIKDGAIGKSMDKILSLISTRKDSRRATQVAMLEHEPRDSSALTRQPLVQTMKAERIAEIMFKLSILLRDRPTTQFLESRNIWRSSQSSIHVTYLKHDKETVSGTKSLVNAASSQVMIYYFAVLESPVIQCTVRSEQDPSQSRMKYVSCCPVHGYYQKTVRKVAFEQRIKKVTSKLEEETGNTAHSHHEQDASTTLAQLVNRYNGRCVCDIWVMKRRFSDFEDLHKHMKEQVSSYVYHLFHMPQKHNMSVVNTSHFLGKRTHGLQEYLRDMLSVLGVSSEVL